MCAATVVPVAEIFTPVLSHVLPLAPSRTELCPGDAPKTICSGTYVITQADVDSGKRNNKATVTCKSPDGQDIENSQHNTVTVLGTSEVSIGEACAD